MVLPPWYIATIAYMFEMLPVLLYDSTKICQVSEIHKKDNQVGKLIPLSACN